MSWQRGEWSPSILPCVIGLCPCDASGCALSLASHPRCVHVFKEGCVEEAKLEKNSHVRSCAVGTTPLPCRARQRTHMDTVHPGQGCSFKRASEAKLVLQ